jgi:hypothetical protein
MLLPTRGQEREKLLLTANYKKRLAEAFKALVTKRRETHVRQLAEAKTIKAAEPAKVERTEVQPRLRIEPCPTFYLRTARAYAFLGNFLLATVGKDRLAKLHGLKQGGTRELSLADELEAIRQRSYGFYLLSCEDIGMKPQFLDDEPVDHTVAETMALNWIGSLRTNPDLACDTRVAVPIYVSTHPPKTRLWATLGVRLAPLKADYARPPRIQPLQQGGAWREVEHFQLGTQSCIIPVDEFAEFELPGSSTLTREEFRVICDRCTTKEEILKVLSTIR